ncbi:MAG: GntR family transcriptional regulator [Victivallaceae bacterium]|nr:GntR family transcriptional regulator [Victivallaceae bacterium]
MIMTSKKYSEREIASDIIEYIVINRLATDTKLITAKQMAERYNVSPMTVNRAIGKLVKQGAVYRRQGSGTFVGKVSSSRAQIKVRVFSWQYNESDPLAQAAYGTFYHALIEGLELCGFSVSISTKLPFHDKIFISEHIERYNLLIVPSGMVNYQTVSLLKKLQTPIILINDDKLSPWPFHQVFHDYVPGFDRALNYVKKIGSKKIFIAGSTGETSEYRCKILEQCAKEAKIHYEELPLLSSDYSTRPQTALIHGREHGRYFMEHKFRGVIFALSDFIAFGILDVLKEYNIKAGNEIKLISYDNLEGRGVYTSDEPVLTSINHPLKLLAEHTVKLAEYIVSHKIRCDDINHIVRVPASELIIRSSA